MFLADLEFALDNIYVYNHANTHDFALDGANATTWVWDSSYYVFGKGFTSDCVVQVGDNTQTSELVSDGCIKVTYDNYSGHVHTNTYHLVVTKTTTSTLSDYIIADNGI